MQTNLRNKEMREELARQVQAAGGVMAFARKHDITHPPISWALSGHRAVTEAIANACGFIAETTYRKATP